MKFITVSELRNESARICREFRDQRDLVLTRSGRPIAIIMGTDEDHVEQDLVDLRQARAMGALKHLQEESVRRGLDRTSMEEIDAESRSSRRS